MHKETSGHTEDYESLFFFFCTCGYCVPHPSIPPSTLHPVALCHFCSLISFTSAFSVGFQWNPTTNDRGLSHATLPRSHPLSHPSLFSSSSSFWLFICLHKALNIRSLLYTLALSRSLSLSHRVSLYILSCHRYVFLCEWVFTCFQAHRCALCLSSHPFSPVIPGLAALYKPSAPNPP